MKPIILFALICNVWAKDAEPLALNDIPRRTPPLHEPNPEALDHQFTENGERLYEGDMVLTEDQLALLEGSIDTRKAIDDVNKRWPNAVVSYAISASSANDRKVIESGLKHWKDNTCVTFEEVDINAAKPHIIFKKLTGCHSKVGMQRTNGQDLSIGRNCETMGTVAHEVGHALGFYHEQSRPDRGQFVTLLDHNLNQTFKHNFRVQNDVNNYGVPYDLGSLMHYGLDYFTVNGGNTMVPKDIHRTFDIGQRVGLSFQDIKLATLMYNCADICPSKPYCQNGGFVDFKCRCRCPQEFIGFQCQTRRRLPAPLCGGDFTSPATIMTPNFPKEYPKDIGCVWLFKAPPGQRVKASFPVFDLTHYQNDAMCHWDFLEVRTTNMDEGSKYCAQDLNKKTITSRGNEMGLLFRSKTNWFNGFKAIISFE